LASAVAGNVSLQISSIHLTLRTRTMSSAKSWK